MTTDATSPEPTPDTTQHTPDPTPAPEPDPHALQTENARLHEHYARALADLDNYRRRVAREKEELRKYAIQALLEDLIPMLDTLTLGLATAQQHPSAQAITDGFKMVADQLKLTLQQHGLQEINPLGEPFDPNAHEALGQNPHDTLPENHITHVHRIGYRLHDRLVRPASVLLSTGPQ
ncbi:MAG: nucleotide exchange factor GrpE [Puniceicoccales bacterium]|jgi:molecular chaperone GrpE|nr:nucleotide exchange factor GrpE [Puniceicoccales bacterium]